MMIRNIVLKSISLSPKPKTSFSASPSSRTRRTVWHAGYVNQEEAAELSKQIVALSQRLTVTKSKDNYPDLKKRMLELKKEYEGITGEPYADES